MSNKLDLILGKRNYFAFVATLIAILFGDVFAENPLSAKIVCVLIVLAGWDFWLIWVAILGGRENS